MTELAAAVTELAAAVTGLAAAVTEPAGAVAQLAGAATKLVRRLIQPANWMTQHKIAQRGRISAEERFFLPESAVASPEEGKPGVSPADVAAAWRAEGVRGVPVR